jgi:hypothetical protein
MLRDVLVHKEFPMKMIRRLACALFCAALLIGCDVSSAPTQPTAAPQPTVNSAEPPPAPPQSNEGAYPSPDGYPAPGVETAYPAPTASP